MGIPVHRILEDIRASKLQAYLKRIHLLKKKMSITLRGIITLHILQKSMKMMQLVLDFGLKK